MKRGAALENIKLAGYHGNSREALKIYTEHRISLAAYSHAYAQGQALKLAGIPCTCMKCKT